MRLRPRYGVEPPGIRRNWGASAAGTRLGTPFGTFGFPSDAFRTLCRKDYMHHWLNYQLHLWRFYFEWKEEKRGNNLYGSNIMVPRLDGNLRILIYIEQSATIAKKIDTDCKQFIPISISIFLDENSEIGAHVRSNLCYWTCLRRLIRSRELKNLFFPKRPIILQDCATCSQLPSYIISLVVVE